MVTERASVCGGGGALFTAHGIRAANSRHRLTQSWSIDYRAEFRLFVRRKHHEI